MSRTWGYWTEAKLQVLAEYLPKFTAAANSVGTCVYVDLFSGDVDNLARDSGNVIAGSPRLALDCNPPFTKVMLCELDGPALRLEHTLRADYPDRDIRVYPRRLQHHDRPGAP